MSGANREMDVHFSRVAGLYSDIRNTDHTPIHFIRDALDGADRIMGADIGCGSGRYSALLLECLEGLNLTCVDANRTMLDELTHNFGDCGIRDFKTVHARIEDLDLEDESLDCVISFNAVHHFDFPLFTTTMRDCLKSGGHGFIYTRTPEQNRQTGWASSRPIAGSAIRELDKVPNPVSVTTVIASSDPAPGRLSREASSDFQLFQSPKPGSGAFALANLGRFSRMRAELSVSSKS